MTTRMQKEKMVEDVKSLAERHALMVVFERGALTVAQTEALRKDLRKEKGTLKVVKNRLMAYCFEDTRDEDKTALMGMFHGQTCIAFSEDAVSAARIVYDFAKEHEGTIVVRGGLCDGIMIDTEAVSQLATMPPLDVVHSRIVGMLQTVGAQLARLLKEPQRRIAHVISAQSSSQDS
ncbi:MAG: 50S ribosomal protein L10 [Alphaproteobacteria bacterium GM7ARS4]|nr:50S ribosomal protein L10 [Alphaproteobacteria bacterium GM7ARS4]